MGGCPAIPPPEEMSKETKIQWCDSTVNPVMGCDGCPLYPVSTLVVINSITGHLKASGIPPADARAALERAFGDRLFSDVYHRRSSIASDVARQIAPRKGPDRDRIASIVERIIPGHLRCYAGLLHSRHGENSLKPGKRANKGYAPRFEKVGTFPGRTEIAAGWKSPSAAERAGKQWLDGLPRLIFVSDMGDALSRSVPFDYLKREIVNVAASTKGSAHIWLWLTKRPGRMAKFAAWLGKQGVPWPENLVAMTSVIDRKMAAHVKHLKEVPAKVRGLSMEPLWDDVDPDLDGIDWVIAGGESGSKDKPFDLAWARRLRDRCRKEGKAFFLKQLGAVATDGGREVPLRDGHGGDWSEWPEDLRVREMPSAFRSLASAERPAGVA